MTWFVYRRPDGEPEVTDGPLKLDIFPGYMLVTTSEQRPQLEGMRLVEGGLVPDLDAQKAIKWEAMKLARQMAIEAPLVTPYGTFDADAESRANIIDSAHLMQTEAQTLAPGSQPTDDFTLADNSVVTLTAGEMVNVALLLAAQIKQAYARGREVRAAIDAAATPEAVQAITWSTP